MRRTIIGITATVKKLFWFLIWLACSQVQAADIPWIWHSSDAPAKAPELALLLDHLSFSGDAIQTRPRKRMLIVGSATSVTPVVHAQSDSRNMPQLGRRHSEAILKAVMAAAGRSSSGWVQLDFEAVESQRPFFLELVADIRRKLPASLKLSVTVLASWCFEADLLDQVRADEVVPMFFRMGTREADYRNALETAPARLHARCLKQAAGFALQEAPPAAVQARYARRYWFNYKNWDTSKGER